MADYKENTLYDCEVKSQAFINSKNGTPGFVLVFLVVNEVDREDESIIYNCEQRDRKIEFWLSEKAINFSVDKLRSLGWEGSKFAELDPSRSGGFSFVDKTIRLVCRHRTADDGFIWDQFDVPYGSKALEIENDPSVANKLDALHGKKLKETATANGAAKKSEPKKEKVTIDASEVGEIPF